MTTIVLAACLGLAATAAITAPVAAQSARELLDRGLQALKDGRFREAVTDLDASYRIEQTPLTLYNLGLAYNGLGYPGKAVAAFESYVKFADPKKDDKTIAAVQKEIERIKGAHARFALTLDPPGASIQIDGKAAALEGGELWVTPGQHRILITAEGHEDYEQILEMQAGRFELDVHLRRPSGPPDVRAAMLLDEGDGLIAAGDIGNAAAKYGAAQRAYPTPRGAGSLGLAQESMGELAEAEANVNKALSSPRDKWIRKNKRRLKQAKRRLEQALATFVITGPDHPGAEVFIDDRPVGTLPLPGTGEVRTQAGVRIITAKLEGYDEFYFEAEIPARGRRSIVVTMKKSAPPPVVAAAPIPVATPATAAPAVGVGTGALSEANTQAPTEAIEEPPAPTQASEAEAEQASQADIEAMAEPEEEGEPPEDYPSVFGLEMAVGAGYQVWLDDPEGNASGAFAVRLFSIGFRPFWPISFGLRLFDAHLDLGTDARIAAGAGPAIYVRGHTQRDYKPLTFDFWAGAAIQPVVFSVATYKAQDLAQNATDVTSLDQVSTADVAQAGLGVGDTVTVQTLNVPLEMGGAFYISKGLALELTLAFSFWIPSQKCYFDANDRVCFEDKLDSLKSLYIGAGVSFLP